MFKATLFCLCLVACTRENPDFSRPPDFAGGPPAAVPDFAVAGATPRDAGTDLRISDLATSRPDFANVADLSHPAVWSSEPSGTTQTLRAIFGSGPGDIYSVGGAGTILHSSGNRVWTLQSSGTSETLTATWSSGPGDAYVGIGGTLLHSTGNGQWTAQTSGGPFNDFSAIWGSAASDVYAVSDNDILHSTGGGSWATALIAPTSSIMFLGVSGRNAGDVYVVGTDESVTNGGMVVHTDGSGTWTWFASGLPSLIAVWASDGGDVYAVGAQGAILHSVAGGSWTPESSGSSGFLLSVWGSTNSDVFAVGAAGVILHSTGNGLWTQESSGNGSDLYAVWGSGAGDVYAVGEGGLILHRAQ